jgi:hypothetical protein
MTPLKVSLSLEEMLQCKQASTLRWQLARASGVGNQRKDQGRNDSDVDYLGIKAELAVAKVFGCNYNVFQLGVDDGADMFLGDISIDVKSTFHEHGKLLFKSLASFKASCSVLVTATEKDNVMSLVGYIPRKQFHIEAKEDDLGHGPCMTMQQIRLKPIESLWRVYQEMRLEK